MNILKVVQKRHKASCFDGCQCVQSFVSCCNAWNRFREGLVRGSPSIPLHRSFSSQTTTFEDQRAMNMKG